MDFLNRTIITPMFAMENKTNLLLSAGNISQLDIVQYLWFQLRLQFNPFWMATAVTTGYLIFLYTVLSLPWQIIYWLKPGFLWKYKMQDAVSIYWFALCETTTCIFHCPICVCGPHFLDVKFFWYGRTNRSSPLSFFFHTSVLFTLSMTQTIEKEEATN